MLALAIVEPTPNAPFKVFIATNGIPAVRGEAATAFAFAALVEATVSDTDFTEVRTTSAIAKAFPTFCNFLPPKLSMFCNLVYVSVYCCSL